MSDIQNLVKLALLTLNTADSENVPVMQVTYLNKVAETAMLLPYGFPSKGVPDETLCLVFNIQGNEENRIAIPLATTNRHKDLKDGESVFENETTKSFLKHLANGDLEINISKDIIQSCKNLTINVDGDYNLITTGDTKIKCANALIDATGRVDIGGTGGKAVARVGDQTSDGASISTGSSKVFAVD